MGLACWAFPLISWNLLERDFFFLDLYQWIFLFFVVLFSFFSDFYKNVACLFTGEPMCGD